MFYRYKLVISYDGYDYSGFQAQEGLKTIEGTINNLLHEWLKKDVKIVGSGRTDKMVHARGQVVHIDLDFEIKCYNLKETLNRHLPLDIRVLDVSRVNEDFHARFSAIKKTYSYKINIKEYDVFSNRYAPLILSLDLDSMIKASKFLIGTHNFKALCSGDIDPRKDLTKTIFDINVIKDDKFVTFYFTGNGFLKYQVRRMMGLLIDVGLHKKNIEDVKLILESKNNQLSNKMAEPYGLCLETVYYNENYEN